MSFGRHGHPLHELLQLKLEDRNGAHACLLTSDEVRAVAPALCVERSFPQERWSADNAYGSDVAITVDIGFYLHVSLYMRIGSSLRVSRCGAVDHIGRIHAQ